MLIYNVLYHNMSDLIIIVGPTASGKTALAIDLAKKLDGEVISADSRQVFKYLDIGSGKVSKKEMNGVMHHMLDVVAPGERYTAMDWLRQAEILIKEIRSRNKIPIICGGTGLYIDALLYGLDNASVENLAQRKVLEGMTLSEVQNILKEKVKNSDNPEYFNNLNNSEKNNKQRLIRKIELSNYSLKDSTYRKLKYNPEMIILSPNKDELKIKIQNRIMERLKHDNNMIEEVRDLIESKGVSKAWLKSLGLEYKYITMYLNNEIDYQTLIKTLEEKIFQYAKRQITWNKKYNTLTKK